MKRFVILCFTTLAATVSLKAQDAGPVLRLDLGQAIEIALDENPTIKIADLEIERQKYVRKETVGNHLPNLSASGSWTRAIVKSDMGGGLSFDPDNTVAAAATLNIPLLVPDVYKTLKLNEEQMRAAVEEARGSRITLINEVKKAYYNILLAEQSLQVLYSSEATTSETVDETRLKFENGLASEYDLITAEVQLSNLRPSIIQTKNSIDVAKRIFKMYLNLPQELDIDVIGDLDDYAGVAEDGIYYLSKDLTLNSDLRAMDIQLDVLQRQFEVARTQRMPTLGAFSNFTVTGHDPINFGDLAGGAGGGSSSNSFFWTNPISAGLQISIPIFAGNSNRMREKQIKNNIKQLEWQREYLEESVNVQLKTALNSLESAWEMLIANSRTISQAQKGYDISRTRYNAGMGTMLEVNSAELALTQAKLNYTQSIYDYLTAMADYEKIIGREE